MTVHKVLIESAKHVARGGPYPKERYLRAEEQIKEMAESLRGDTAALDCILMSIRGLGLIETAEIVLGEFPLARASEFVVKAQ